VDAVEVTHNNRALFWRTSPAGSARPAARARIGPREILERILDGKGTAEDIPKTCSASGENITGQGDLRAGRYGGHGVSRGVDGEIPPRISRSGFPMAKRVKLKFNGKEVEADEGRLLIDVAKDEGVEIPHYCYHPALGNPGNCRMCIVEGRGARPSPWSPAACPRAEGIGRQVRFRRGQARPKPPRSSCTWSTTRSTVPSATNPASAACRTIT